LKARVRNADRARGDVDLYLYFCASNKCELKAYSTRGNSQESVTVVQPEAGKWKVVVDPVSIPPRGLRLEYTDAFTPPALSTVPGKNRRIVRLVRVMSRGYLTVGYDYNSASQKVEPVKQRVSLGDVMVELRPVKPNAPNTPMRALH
jgi:hypothetical protein